MGFIPEDLFNSVGVEHSDAIVTRTTLPLWAKQPQFSHPNYQNFADLSERIDFPALPDKFLQMTLGRSRGDPEDLTQASVRKGIGLPRFF